MVNRSWMTRRCAAANSCGVWNKEEEKEEEESLPGEAASSWQPRLGARAAAAAAFQSQMSLINSSASQFIPILGDQMREGELQKFEEAWGAFTLDTYPIWSSTHTGIFFFSFFFLFVSLFPISQFCTTEGRRVLMHLWKLKKINEIHTFPWITTINVHSFVEKHTLLNSVSASKGQTEKTVCFFHLKVIYY